MTRKRRKTGDRDKPKNKIIVLKGTKEDIEPLFEKESEAVRKIWGRDKDFKKRLESTEKLLGDFLHNPEFRKIIYANLGQNKKRLFLLQPKVLRDIVATKVIREDGVEKLGTLVENLANLDKLYGARINLRKDEKGDILIKKEYSFPNYRFFRVKGSEIIGGDYKEKILGFYKSISKFKCIYNEIEIQDEPYGSGSERTSTNLLYKVLSMTSNVSPTIIKYELPKGLKRMLVCVPSHMDITTLVKKYGALISKVHSDFYEKRFRGRPMSMQDTRRLIHEIWEQRFKGKKFPINRRCNMTSEILLKNYRISISSATIRRHYLREIRGEAGEK